MSHRPLVGSVLLALAFAGTLALGPARPAAARTEAAMPRAARSFATSGDAVAALIAALRRGDEHALRAILGPGSGKLIASGDRVADATARARFLAAFDEHHALGAAGPDREVLKVGADDWPLPLPLVQTGGTWHFDSALGAQELVDRRIGRNEIAAISTALACVDAQKRYFARASEHGQGEYAQRLVSTRGKHDGLYWPTTAGEPDSPLTPLVETAEAEGYPGELVAGKPTPYQGYYFRILTAQGASAPSGAMDYVSGGRMTKGFALVAWPAGYGASGIMTFIVNQDGVVFQKDLGPRTAALAHTLKLFDPDLSWTRVDVIKQ